MYTIDIQDKIKTIRRPVADDTILTIVIVLASISGTISAIYFSIN